MNTANLNQMLFYVQYEAHDSGSGLIGFLQILKGLEAEGHQDGSSGSLRPPRYEDMPKRYRHADGRYFGVTQ